MNLSVVAWLHALLYFMVPCVALEKKQGCEISVAALGLPSGSDGLLHWRTGITVTSPLQLSTRYFSECLKLESTTIHFYKEPVLAVSPKEPLPKPLIALKIPEDQKLVYIILWTEPDGQNGVKWCTMMLNGKDWKSGSLKIVSACKEEIGVSAGKKNMPLAPGKSLDFFALDWADSFPIKIFQIKPEQKLVFSSKWRVAPGRREICFLGNINGTTQVRSLIELSKPEDL